MVFLHNYKTVTYMYVDFSTKKQYTYRVLVGYNHNLIAKHWGARRNSGPSESISLYGAKQFIFYAIQVPMYDLSIKNASQVLESGLTTINNPTGLHSGFRSPYDEQRDENDSNVLIGNTDSRASLPN